MNFFHVHIGPGQAAANEPHAAFAMGPALSNALKDLDTKAQIRSTLAAQHFHEFCARSGVAICDAPGLTKGVTASWHEEDGHALRRILFRARHNDLVVAGRAKSPNGLPTDFLEQLIIGSGCPMLIAGPSPTPGADRYDHGVLEGNGRGGPRREGGHAVLDPREARGHREHRRERRECRRRPERRRPPARVERHSV
jgi:hypothetical protein